MKTSSNFVNTMTFCSCKRRKASLNKDKLRGQILADKIQDEN